MQTAAHHTHLAMPKSDDELNPTTAHPDQSIALMPIVHRASAPRCDRAPQSAKHCNLIDANHEPQSVQKAQHQSQRNHKHLSLIMALLYLQNLL
jgi:hypothetical protein